MFSPKIALFSLTSLALFAALASPLTHAVQRTHVSAAFGSDANTATNCTAAAPCRFFAAAMSVTDNNGEVIVLDSGGYGAVTITKSLALIAPSGVYAGISVFPGSDGVTIATPGVNVTLRGLTINGQGGNNGISMTEGNRLTVDNCVISNLARDGIIVSTAATVRVMNTIIRGNASRGIFLQNGARGTVIRATVSGSGDQGIRVEGSLPGTTTLADIADTTVDTGFIGVWALSTNASAEVIVSVRDSRLVGNGNAGAFANSIAGGKVNLLVSNSISAKNAGTGILASGLGVTVLANGNTVTNNTTGFQNNSSGLFESAGDNLVRNNGTDIVNAITVVAAN
jgi:Right handed beta helix region